MGLLASRKMEKISCTVCAGYENAGKRLFPIISAQAAFEQYHKEQASKFIQCFNFKETCLMSQTSFMYFCITSVNNKVLFCFMTAVISSKNSQHRKRWKVGKKKIEQKHKS